MSTFSIVPFSQPLMSSQVPSIFTSLFDDFNRDLLGSQSYGPSANITKGDEGYRIDLAVPGYDRSDIDVGVKNGTLTVESTVSFDSQNNYNKEFTVGPFKKQWSLPKNTNEKGISATYKNGVLSLEIPSSKENQRKIKIG